MYCCVHICEQLDKVESVVPRCKVVLCVFLRERTLEEVSHKLCVCNAVREALEGQVVNVYFQQLLLKPNKRTIDFLLEV